MSKSVQSLWILSVILFGLLSTKLQAHESAHHVFEMRTYTTVEGKLEALNSRFRNHTIALFEKHGITNIGYWLPTDKPNTLIYIVSHKNKNEAADSWQSFINDPEWKKVYAQSIANGKLVANIESVFMLPTDYSQIK